MGFLDFSASDYILNEIFWFRRWLILVINTAGEARECLYVYTCTMTFAQGIECIMERDTELLSSSNDRCAPTWTYQALQPLSCTCFGRSLIVLRGPIPRHRPIRLVRPVSKIAARFVTHHQHGWDIRFSINEASPSYRHPIC
jgi:hypothetical protein